MLCVYVPVLAHSCLHIRACMRACARACVCVCARVRAHACVYLCVWVCCEGQLVIVSFFLPSCGSQGLNSRCQTWQQVFTHGATSLAFCFGTGSHVASAGLELNTNQNGPWALGPLTSAGTTMATYSPFFWEKPLGLEPLLGYRIWIEFNNTVLALLYHLLFIASAYRLSFGMTASFKNKMNYELSRWECWEDGSMEFCHDAGRHGTNLRETGCPGRIPLSEKTPGPST